MLTPEQLATIRSQLTTITQGQWTVSSSPLADSRYMGFVCDCAQSHRDNSHQYVISDEHYGDAVDDARFIAEAPTTIKLLLDEVDRLTTERTLLVGVWRAADEYNDCNDGLTCNCVDNLVKALDKYDEYRKALTVVSGG